MKPAGERPAPGKPPLRSPLVLVLAWRFLRGGRSRLLQGTSRAALAATGLGVMAMVISMALMTGYQEELERKLSSGNAAVLAIPVGLSGGPGPQEVRAALAALPGVVRVSPVVLGQGVLSSAASPEGVEVMVRGVEPDAGPFSAPSEQLAAGEDGVPGAVLGAELARRLGAADAEVLRMVGVALEKGRPRFRYRSLRFAGTFEAGLSEFDRSWLLVEKGTAEGLYGPGGGSTMYEIEPDRLDSAPALAAEVEDVLGARFLVTSWLDLNRELFAALRLQKLFLFLVLGLIVLVSTFNVASTVVVSVRDRMREVGVLGAVGLDPRRLRRAFLLYGGMLGSLGVLGGVAAGCAVAWVFDRFELIRFDADVAAIYFINAVRFRVEPLDVAGVVAFALAVNLAACALPAWWASRVRPSQALRYE